jgi:ATP/maltotriose-dependent transcriptional regulator MalT/DNA-binding SARP family transcriptional activator
MAVQRRIAAPVWALARPRLRAALEAAPCALVVLRAGAGYGKTIVAAQWTASRPGTRWLQPEALVAGRSESWNASAGDLVVDGYTPGNRALDTALASLVEQCPEGRHLLLLSRAEPDLELGRRRVEGTVLEIGAAELAFDRSEALGLLSGSDGGHDEALVDTLIRRTLGWPAALRLALGLARNSSVTGRPAEISGAAGPLADYVEAEIWRPLNPDQREFALATALLEEFQPEWCDGISDCGGGARMVRELRAAETWLLPPRQLGEGFRQHPLVREFFLARLSEQPARRHELARRSARTLATNRRTMEAAELALHAEDWDLALEFLRHGADRAFREGHGEKLREYLGRFPQSYRDRPALLRIEGYLSWAVGDLEVAMVKATQAAETADIDLRADALILQAAVRYAQGNFTDERAALQQAIDLGPGDAHVLAKAWFGLGSLHYRAGRIPEAEAALQRSASLTHEGEPVHDGVLSVLALLPLSQGRPRAAIAGLTRAVESNRKVGNRRGEAHACYHLAIALNQSGMHQRALDTLAEAERQARQLGLAHLAALVSRETADAHRDLGTGEAAERYRQAIAELLPLGASAGLLHAYNGLAVHLRRENDPLAARRAAEQALEHAASGDPSFVTLVRLHLALLAGDIPAVRELLAEARGHSHRYYLTLALLYCAAADREGARERAREALALIQDEGFEHLLREEGELAAPWLTAISRERAGATDRANPRGRFRLWLLGDLTLEGPEGEPPKTRPQALRLLAYLALRRGATVDAEQLIDALWPGRDNEMRPTMQTLIWSLRRNLHERVIVTHASGYTFDPDELVSVDVEEFGRHLREERFDQSIELYRGELLPGVEWAEMERRHLENRYLQALEDLADRRYQQGREGEAIELLERLVAVDPLAEEAVGKLVAWNRRAGREDVARRLRRDFAWRLEREVGFSLD